MLVLAQALVPGRCVRLAVGMIRDAAWPPSHVRKGKVTPAWLVPQVAQDESRRVGHKVAVVAVWMLPIVHRRGAAALGGGGARRRHSHATVGSSQWFVAVHR